MFFVILCFVLIYYLPIIINSGLILSRSNDLQEFFWPTFLFVKKEILAGHGIPLWNNSILSGTPLVTDPQAPIFYPLNAIFLALPMGTAFIASFIIHSVIGGWGIYIAFRRGVGFSKSASLIAAILYASSPKTAGYLTAGHFGLVASSAWIPYVLYSSLEIIKKPKLKWALVYAASLVGIYFTHMVIFIIAAVLSALTISVAAFLRRNRKSFLILAAGILITFGLVSVSLLPQIEWSGYSTRFILLNDRNIYPKWNSVFEIFRNAVFPMSVSDLDTEKWIPIGIFGFFLSIIGFFNLKQGKLKLSLTLLFLFVLIANNATPFYKLLNAMDWYVLMRVSTRVWFLVILIVIFLETKVYQGNPKRKIVKALVILAVIENIGLSWKHILTPVEIEHGRFASREVFEFISQDKGRYRVFCTTRCLSQKTSVEYGLELMEGYNTVQQMNYYKHAWQLTNSYWNYYTLAIPPIGAYKSSNIQPTAKYLGDYNVKYVVSPFRLNDKDFNLAGEIGGFLIYENKLFLPRVNVPILVYRPNFIRLDASNFEGGRITISEVYSPGWKAYLDGKTKIVEETPISLRSVNVDNGRYLDLMYKPDGYLLGRLITLITVVGCISLIIYEKKF